jgi:transcription antitermination factor NusB
LSKRRKARELALQFLYQLDLRGAGDAGPHEAEFWAQHSAADEETREFVTALVNGTRTHRAKIDEMITQSAEHWNLERMSVVDRNILRLAVFELGWERDVPPRVAINEAIEIAKKFGTRESGRFINGVLDRVHRELRPAS